MILITGGTGYIGSHACMAFVAAGYETVLVDNLSNSSAHVVERLGALAGRHIQFIEGDVRDTDTLNSIFKRFPIAAVVHFAGLKSVSESVEAPLIYFDNNVAGTLKLLEAMQSAGCRQLVFSSSATIYGQAEAMPVTEDAPLSAKNPYGRSKLMVEEMLSDLECSDPSWRIARLRYFNPVGAHESALIGEDPRGVPNNLMPYVAQVAVGKLPELLIYGDDYSTVDGTGVRDYIHVMDLAEGHVAALRHLKEHDGGFVVNLGTGRGTSVRQMVDTFERVSGQRIPFRIVARRPGDVAICFADVSRAHRLLKWRALRSTDQMCGDAWRWQQKIKSVDQN